MNSQQLWNHERVQNLLTSEMAIVISLFIFLTWVGYKLFLRRVSADRHRIFQDLFRNLAVHFSIASILFSIYSLMPETVPFLGLLTVVWACVVLIKTSRILAYEYLFLTSMKALVPLLIVNILTLVGSLVAIVWILKTIFMMDLTPLLATSAVLSIVLGIALQDTLGNLFAGISIQFDKPFELGDWVEVKNGSDKIVGLVEEISWRSTLLRSMTDEFITLPNRIVAQSQISNFAARENPFLRSQIFRLPLGTDVAAAKSILARGIKDVPGVLEHPVPAALLMDTTESWLTFKLFYNLRDFGSQYMIADKCLEKALDNLRKAGIPLATERLEITKTDSSAPEL